VRFHHVGTPFFVLAGWRGNQEQPQAGRVEKVAFRNIVGDDVTETWGSAISGTQVAGHDYRIYDVTFENVQVAFKGGLPVMPSVPPEYHGQYPDPNQLNQPAQGNLPASGLYFRHVKRVSIAPNCSFGLVPGQADVRPLIDHSDDANGNF